MNVRRIIHRTSTRHVVLLIVLRNLALKKFFANVTYVSNFVMKSVKIC